MDKHIAIQGYANKICNAKTIRFISGWSDRHLDFDIDNHLGLYLAPWTLTILLTDERYIEARQKFIKILANPTEFLNDDCATHVKLPVELTQRKGTETFAEKQFSTDLIQKRASQILNATSIKFAGRWLHRDVFFEFDRETSVPIRHLMIILSDENYSEARDAFIEKLSNPAQFANDDGIVTFVLPKELELKAKMSAFADEQI